MDLDSPTSPNNPPNVEEEAYEIAPRAPGTTPWLRRNDTKQMLIMSSTRPTIPNSRSASKIRLCGRAK